MPLGYLTPTEVFKSFKRQKQLFTLTSENNPAAFCRISSDTKDDIPQHVVKVIGHCNDLFNLKDVLLSFAWRLRCLSSFIPWYSYDFVSSQSEDDEKKTTENAVELWSEKPISTEDRWYLSPGKTLIITCDSVVHRLSF